MYYLCITKNSYSMKRTIAFLMFIACIASYDASAQSVSANLNMPIATSVEDARFEFVQSTIFSKYAFLVDKNNGDVWKLSKMKELEKVERKNPDKVDTTQRNYQLYLNSEGKANCLLLNIHTGRLWRYESEGNGQFVEIKRP